MWYIINWILPLYTWDQGCLSFWFLIYSERRKDARKCREEKEEEIKKEAGRTEVKIGWACRRRWIRKEVWRKGVRGRTEGGEAMSIPRQGREPVCMCVRAPPNSHIPKLLGGNLIRFLTRRWWQRQRAVGGRVERECESWLSMWWQK